MRRTDKRMNYRDRRMNVRRTDRMNWRDRMNVRRTDRMNERDRRMNVRGTDRRMN